MSKAIEQEDAVARVDSVDTEVPQKQKKPHLDQRRKRQPRYNVILWNDDDHTYDYVIRMMHDLFGHSYVNAFRMAKEVDSAGRTICLTTTLEHAELKSRSNSRVRQRSSDSQLRRFDVLHAGTGSVADGID